MAEYQLTKLFQQILGKKGKKPHPAIFRITPEPGECAICGERKWLSFLDREMDQEFCETCLENVAAADQALNLVFARPAKLR